MTSARRVGDLLVERGFISADHLRAALRIQSHERKRLGQILVEMGVLSPEQLNWTLSELLGVPYVDLTEEMVDLDVARTMPEEVLRRHQAVPVLRVGDELTVVLADPTNHPAVVELEALSGVCVRTAFASSETVSRLLERAFPRTVCALERGRGPDLVAIPPASPGATDGDSSGIAHAYGLLVDAAREGASELCLDPLPEEIRVRHRIDGKIVERPRLPREVLAAVLSRFRILAGLRGEGLPAQAHVRTRLVDQDVDLDFLFFRTVYGEAVTISLTTRWSEAPGLDALELSLEAQTAITNLLTPAGGLVFVTGWEPRARGTLLYAMARAVATPASRTLTLERTVSFVLPEFVQVEVPGDFGATVATLLAQPADVALVEDARSAGVCLAAFASAERGTLVLAGLGFSTNATALAHLMTLDVPRLPFLAAIRGLVHVRRLGARKRVEVLPMTDALRRELGARAPDGHR